ncbi:hypothetical protein E1288_45260 [Saccharopolyspora elongata]|uniref:Uncharacterized protein n=1 Tax=Saccharopolyspora elongata TaxID=2530387 RepID=A0A4R4XR54_9PSEU|nr:hypothetical protein E1288_45260 [Saccharopolyspora elongata]
MAFGDVGQPLAGVAGGQGGQVGVHAGGRVQLLVGVGDDGVDGFGGEDALELGVEVGGRVVDERGDLGVGRPVFLCVVAASVP